MIKSLSEMFLRKKLTLTVIISSMALLGITSCDLFNKDEKPSAPVIVVEQGVQANIIKWAEIDGADYYNIYYTNEYPFDEKKASLIPNITVEKDSEEVTDSKVVKEVEYIHESLPLGQPYFYVVRAKNDIGESGDSNLGFAIPSADTAKEVKVTAITGGFTVSWTATGSVTYKTHNIYYSTAPGIDVKKLKASNNTEDTADDVDVVKVTNVASSPKSFTGLADATYYVVITTVTSGGESVPTTEVSTALPEIVTGVTVTSISGQNTISWTPVAGASAYNIYWSTTIPVTKDSNSVANVSSPYVHSGLTSGTAYFYVVTSKNGKAESEVSVMGFGNATGSSGSVGAVASTAQKLRGIWVLTGTSAAGATGFSSAVSGVDLYDQESGTWYNNITTLPVPVSFAGVESATVNGSPKLFVIGGLKSNGDVSAYVQIYDITTNTWGYGSAAGFTPRANIRALNVGGKIITMGGTTVAAATAWAGSTVSEEYDPVSNTWTAKLAFGTAGSGRAMALLDGVVYNSGGRSGAAVGAVTHAGLIYTTNVLATAASINLVPLTIGKTGHQLIIYKPTSSSATPVMWILGGISTPITGATGAYILQGTTVFTVISGAGSVQTLNYPFATGVTWANGPNLTTGTAFGAAALIRTTGDVYYFGGASGSSAVSSQCIKSNMGTGAAWEAKTAMTTARWGHAAVTIK